MDETPEKSTVTVDKKPEIVTQEPINKETINVEELSKKANPIYIDDTDDENFFDDFFSDDE